MSTPEKDGWWCRHWKKSKKSLFLSSVTHYKKNHLSLNEQWTSACMAILFHNDWKRKPNLPLSVYLHVLTTVSSTIGIDDTASNMPNMLAVKVWTDIVYCSASSSKYKYMSIHQSKVWTQLMQIIFTTSYTIYNHYYLTLNVYLRLQSSRSTRALCARAVRVCGQTGSRSDQSDQQQICSQRQVTLFERCWQLLGCVRDWTPLPGQCVSAVGAAPEKSSRLWESSSCNLQLPSNRGEESRWRKKTTMKEAKHWGGFWRWKLWAS